MSEFRFPSSPSGRPRLVLGDEQPAAGYGLGVLALVLFWLALIYPWASGERTIPWDAKAHFQPQIQFLAQSLARGEAPFWVPYVFSGHPQIADPQAMIFSPPFLALALFTRAPSLRAVDLTILASGLIGALALMLWFRDRGWHWAGALIAGLAFVWGGSMAWRIQHVGQVLSLATFPLALLCLDRAMGRRSYLWAALTGLAVAHLIIGRDQVALLSLYVLAGFGLWRWLGADAPLAEIRQTLGPLVVAALVALALAALPIALTASLAATSNRPEIDYVGAARGSLHPALLITLVAPQVFGAAGAMADYWGPPSFTWEGTGLYIAQNMGQLYVGALPLVLAALGLLSGQLLARDIRYFTLALLVVLLYALGWYTPVFRGLYELVPGVKLYRRPADATFVIGALLAILAGYATHRLFSTPWLAIARGRALVIAAGVALAILIGVGLGWHFDRLGRLPEALLPALMAFAAAALALAWAVPRLTLEPRLAALGLAAVTTADLAWNNGPSTSSAMPAAMYEAMQPDTQNATIRALKWHAFETSGPTRRDRVELVGLGFHWPNLALTHNLESTLGYNPVRLGDYSQATGAEDTVGLPEQRRFAPLMPGYRSRLADLLGLRWIASSVPIEKVDKALRPGDLRLVATTPEGFLYENERALPRVLFATRSLPARFDLIRSTGGWPDFDPTTTVLLEDEPAVRTAGRPGSARILTYANNRVDVEVESPDGGFLVLNDLWHPWWRATIGGNGAPLLKANVLFRAVAVPGGRHTVRFEFRPFAGLVADLLRRGQHAVSR